MKGKLTESNNGSRAKQFIIYEEKKEANPQYHWKIWMPADSADAFEAVQGRRENRFEVI